MSEVAIDGFFDHLREIVRQTKSKAALAVTDACALAVNAALEKHPRRGDSWEDSFTPHTCFNLAGAKVKRVELLLDGMAEGHISHAECAEEMTEEGVDAIVYLAFGLWQIGRL